MFVSRCGCCDDGQSIDFLRNNKGHVTCFVAFTRMHPCLYVMLCWFASMLASMAAMTIGICILESLIYHCSKQAYIWCFVAMYNSKCVWHGNKHL